MERAEKGEQLKLLEERFLQAGMAVCADYRGLNVAQIARLRRDLRQVGAATKVVKNNLARISAKQAFQGADAEKLQKFLDLFEGPSFVIFSGEDPVASAKTAVQAAKDLQQFKIKGGWFEGSFLDQEKVVELSKMPGREEMLGMLLSVMQAPASQLVRLLNAPAAQLVRVIDAYRSKLEEQG
jgi:large subunit ribosomal protein L10